MAANTDRDPAEYLSAVFRLNPLDHPGEILAARDRYLGRSSAKPAPAGYELLEQREAQQNQIDWLRAKFWTATSDQLRESFAALDVGPFPDLKLAAERLQAAFRARQEFPLIAQHGQYDQDLFSKLKEIVVASPRDAGPIKQACLQCVSEDAALHRRWQKMIHILHREFSSVYSLEADWLDEIVQSQTIQGETATEKAVAKRRGNEEENPLIRPLMTVSIIVCLMFVRGCLNSSVTTPSRPKTPTFSPLQFEDLRKQLSPEAQQVFDRMYGPQSAKSGPSSNPQSTNSLDSPKTSEPSPSQPEIPDPLLDSLGEKAKQRVAIKRRIIEEILERRRKRASQDASDPGSPLPSDSPPASSPSVPKQ